MGDVRAINKALKAAGLGNIKVRTCKSTNYSSTSTYGFYNTNGTRMINIGYSPCMTDIFDILAMTENPNVVAKVPMARQYYYNN